MDLAGGGEGLFPLETRLVPAPSGVLWKSVEGSYLPLHRAEGQGLALTVALLLPGSAPSLAQPPWPLMDGVLKKGCCLQRPTVQRGQRLRGLPLLGLGRRAERLAEVGVGGINNLPGPPPSSALGPWGVNQDWCSRPQVCSPHTRRASWMPLRGTCLCGSSGCA